MLLKFVLNGRNLIFTNPEILNNGDSISYIQCRVDLKSAIFKPSDTLVALFKSASYDIKEEVVMSTSYDIKDGEFVNITSLCFIPSKVFEHGGVIQFLIYKKDGERPYKAQEATNVVEFFIKPDRYVPMTVPDMWQALTNEVVSLRTLIDLGLDYETLSNKPLIEGVTLIGDKSYEELRLKGITANQIINIVNH